jgi:hypothetical protein
MHRSKASVATRQWALDLGRKPAGARALAKTHSSSTLIRMILGNISPVGDFEAAYAAAIKCWPRGAHHFAAFAFRRIPRMSRAIAR